MAKAGATVSSYQDLLVWQRGMDLAVATYRVSAALPREELYGLSSQIRRSAGSIPANIAEGYGRDNRGSYIQHLRIAQGSLKELETHLILATRVGIIDGTTVNPLMEAAAELGRMLRSMIRSLEAK